LEYLLHHIRIIHQFNTDGNRENEQYTDGIFVHYSILKYTDGSSTIKTQRERSPISTRPVVTATAKHKGAEAAGETATNQKEAKTQ
jgi:hypothetical protein